MTRQRTYFLSDAPKGYEIQRPGKPSLMIVDRYKFTERGRGTYSKRNQYLIDGAEEYKLTKFNRPVKDGSDFDWEFAGWKFTRKGHEFRIYADFDKHKATIRLVN